MAAKKSTKKRAATKSAPKRAKTHAGANTAPKRAPKRAKTASPALTKKEKSRLVKPAGTFAETTQRFVTTWIENRKILRVAGVSPAKIQSSLRRATRAVAREEKVRAKVMARLQPLTDVRMLAEHEVWKLVLDVWASAKAQGRIHPELLTAFAFMSEARKVAVKSAPKAATGGDAGGAKPA